MVPGMRQNQFFEQATNLFAPLLNAIISEFEQDNRQNSIVSYVVRGNCRALNSHEEKLHTWLTQKFVHFDIELDRKCEHC